MNGSVDANLPKPNKAFRSEIYAKLGNQRRAARALGVSEGHLSSIINGWIPPGRGLASRASSLFGKPVHELFPNLQELR